MKAIDSGAEAAWLSNVMAHDCKVEVDSTGSDDWVDLTDWYGFNWVQEVSVTESSDAQVATASVTLARKCDNYNLSPYVTGSILNNVGGVYTPALHPYRRIRIWGYVGDYGMARSSMVAVPLFEGRIDTVDNAGGGGEFITLQCRDVGCDLQDEYIEDATIYGSDVGVNIAVVMQDIMDDWLSNPFTLYDPNTALFSITTYAQQKASVMDALRALGDLIGWDLRAKWNPGDTEYQIAFYDPQRATTTSLFEFSADHKLEVSQLAMDRTNVRNRVCIVYTDPTTGLPDKVLRTDSASITKYGPRYMEISEDASQGIDTTAEAEDMADAILADTKEPLAVYESNVPFFPWAELTDLYTFESDSQLSDDDIKIAVVGITHTISADGNATTRLSLRGQPCAGNYKWLRMETRAGVATPWLDRTLSQPDNVVAASRLGGIQINFDAPTDPDWAYALIFVDTNDDFTPSQDTLIYRGRQTSQFVGSLIPGTLYYVKIIFVNKDGVESAESTQASIAASYVGPAHENGSGEARGEANRNSDMNVWSPPNDISVGPSDNWAIYSADPSTGDLTLEPTLWVDDVGPSAYAEQLSQTGEWSSRLTVVADNTGDVDSTVLPVGIRSLGGVAMDARSELSGGVDMAFPISAGALYDLDSLISADVADLIARAVIGIDFFDTDKEWVSRATFSTILTVSPWQRLRGRFRSPSTALYAVCFVEARTSGFFNTDALDHIFLVDYLKLRRSDIGFERTTYDSATSGTTFTNTLRPLTFTTETFDFGGDATAGTSAQGDYFTCPEEGFYEFEACCKYTTTSLSNNFVILLQTSIDLSTWATVKEGARIYAASGADYTATLQAKLYLTQGKYVRVAIQKSSSTAETIDTNATTARFSGLRVDAL